MKYTNNLLIFIIGILNVLFTSVAALHASPMSPVVQSYESMPLVGSAEEKLEQYISFRYQEIKSIPGDSEDVEKDSLDNLYRMLNRDEHSAYLLKDLDELSEVEKNELLCFLAMLTELYCYNFCEDDCFSMQTILFDCSAVFQNIDSLIYHKDLPINFRSYIAKSGWDIQWLSLKRDLEEEYSLLDKYWNKLGCEYINSAFKSLLEIYLRGDDVTLQDLYKISTEKKETFFVKRNQCLLSRGDLGSMLNSLLGICLILYNASALYVEKNLDFSVGSDNLVFKLMRFKNKIETNFLNIIRHSRFVKNYQARMTVGAICVYE